MHCFNEHPNNAENSMICSIVVRNVPSIISETYRCTDDWLAWCAPTHHWKEDTMANYVHNSAACCTLRECAPFLPALGIAHRTHSTHNFGAAKRPLLHAFSSRSSRRMHTDNCRLHCHFCPIFCRAIFISRASAASTKCFSEIVSAVPACAHPFVGVSILFGFSSTQMLIECCPVDNGKMVSALKISRFPCFVFVVVVFCCASFISPGHAIQMAICSMLSSLHWYCVSRARMRLCAMCIYSETITMLMRVLIYLHLKRPE